MSNFFKNNRNKYKEQIIDNSISIFHSGMLIKKSADEDFEFEVNKNFYYLTGINQDNVCLIMVKENGNYSEYLFLEKNDPIKVKWIGAKLEKEEAIMIGCFDNVLYYDEYDLKEFVNLYLNKGVINVYTNIEKDNHFYNFEEEYINKLIDRKNIIYLSGYEIVVNLRTYKEEYEIALLKESIEVTKTGIEELMLNSMPGMLEYELESYFDFHIKNNGQRTNSFKTIAAGGKNATILHYSSNNCELNDGDLVLFDLGCKTNFYCSDITRTFPVNGVFTERQKEVYNEVLNVNKKCIEFLKPGVTRKEFNNYADSLIIKACYNLGLIKEDKEYRNYYWHSIGHSLGLDTHDPCDYNKPLQEGYVITVEPGIYIEEENIGIRIEDDVLITKNGAENLSESIIKEVDDIEKFMKKF